MRLRAAAKAGSRTPASLPSAIRAVDVDWLPFPWFVAALATLLWWPLGTYWQSDDWIALEYARELDRALADFTGPQYGLVAMAQFWRPLVTLSFWLEQALLPPSPFVSHLFNALLFGLSAMLLGRLTARFLGASAGLAAAAIWAFSPVHAGSILWAVGRVDGMATCFVLAATLAHLRWREGRARTRAVALVCAAAALASKEVAFAFPLIVGLLEWGAAAQTRMRRAWTGAWPYLLLAAAAAVVRIASLGGIGGYGSARPELASTIGGFFVWTARALDPLLLLDRGAWVWLGLLPAAFGIAGLLLRGGRRAVFVLLALYLVTMLPSIQFWAHVGEPKGLRQMMLPFAPLAVLLAGGGRLNAVLVPLLFALPHVAARQAHLEAGVDSALRHEELRAELAAAGLHFVAGLPRENPDRTVYQFHFGVDRLVDPPRRLFALRPLVPEPDAYAPQVAPADGVPQATSWRFVAPGELRHVPPASGAFEVSWDGPSHLSRATLHALRDRTVTARIRVPGKRSDHYRLTLFTAGGWLTTLVPDAGSGPDGVIDVRQWLAEGKYAPGGNEKLFLFPLGIATTLDRELTFPLLVETAGGDCARQLLSVRFDRDLARMLDA